MAGGTTPLHQLHPVPAIACATANRRGRSAGSGPPNRFRFVRPCEAVCAHPTEWVASVPLPQVRRGVAPFVRRCEELRTAPVFLFSVLPKVIPFLQPLQNLISHGTYLRRRDHAKQAHHAVGPICVWKAPAFLRLALLDPAPAIHFEKPAGGRQFQPIPAPDQAVLHKFLPCHAKVSRDADDFLFRKRCTVLPAAVSALAAIISVKQFPMER